MMKINHNLTAMNSHRQLGISTGVNATSSEKLASGYKINKAADDAAGLKISERLRRQVTGLNRASSNGQDGMSLVQVADGAMSEIHDMLQRGSELAIKAATGTITDEDRQYIQTEISALQEEIDVIKEKTTFNGIYVLKGTSTNGADLGITIDTTSKMPSWVNIEGADNGTFSEGIYDGYKSASIVDFSAFDGSEAKKSELAGTGFHFTCCTCNNHYSIEFKNGGGNEIEEFSPHFIYKVDISEATDPQSLIQKIVEATTDKTKPGQPQDHFTILKNLDPDGNSSKLVVYDERPDQTPNKEAGEGLFADGVAKKYTQYPDTQGDVILQLGAENKDEDRLKIELPYVSTQTCKIDTVSVLTQEAALDAIDKFKQGIEFINGERSRLGSYQNSIEHAVRNLDNWSQNTQSSESIIRDTDMATEMIKYSNSKILKQAGESILAQANQTNEGVKALLQQ